MGPLDPSRLGAFLMRQIPPSDGEVVERGNVLPLGTYRTPDGRETTTLAFPQPMREGLDALAYALGYRQDPNAPAGYVTHDALNKGGQGLAESAMVGSLGARAPAGALRSGMGRRGANQIDEMTGLPLNEDGTVTLYHATKTPEAADAIRTSKKLRSAAEPDVYLSTAKEGTGYGDYVVGVRVDPRRLSLDDEFPDGRMDFRISTGRPGGSTDIELAANAKPAVGVGAALSTARNRRYPSGELVATRTEQPTSPYAEPYELKVYPKEAVKEYGSYNAMVRGTYNDDPAILTSQIPDDVRGTGLGAALYRRWAEEVGGPFRSDSNVSASAQRMYEEMFPKYGYNVLRNPDATFTDAGSLRTPRATDVRPTGPIEKTHVYRVEPPGMKHSTEFYANPLAGAVPLAWRQPQEQQQGPMMGEQMGRRIPPEEEAQRQALIRYLQGVQ